MSISIEVEDDAWQRLPDLEAITKTAIGAVLEAGGLAETEVYVLFTDDQSIAELNAKWRGQAKATNVLSFPAPEEMPLPPGEPRLLGDIVLAFGVVSREAAEQCKTLHDHAAHLIIHGVLHLLGHDHEDEDEATAMEQLEIGILKGLGISNPYERQ
jgi:probable rRNA maturation factor